MSFIPLSISQTNEATLNIEVGSCDFTGMVWADIWVQGRPQRHPVTVADGLVPNDVIVIPNILTADKYHQIKLYDVDFNEFADTLSVYAIRQSQYFGNNANIHTIEFTAASDMTSYQDDRLLWASDNLIFQVEGIAQSRVFDRQTGELTSITINDDQKVTIIYFK